jgi:DNA-directed RNA polymerase specialized sigma subunit
MRVLARLSQRLGREARSRDIADLLGTSDDNVRQVLKEYGGIRTLRT